MAEDSSGVIRFLLVMTLFIVFVTASLLSYSKQGYTFTKYPHVDGEAVICVEGEVHPTNQTITVLNDDDKPTVNPYVTINNETTLFNLSVTDKGVRQKTELLRLGCNKISYNDESDSKFKVKINYLSHWRPIVKYLEIGNLQVGHSVRYFISTEDADKRRVVTSRLNITDITKDEKLAPVLNAEFNGSAMRYKMEQPGNYMANMQVFDGYVWSDVYEVGFTAHVITTEEQKKAYRIYMLEDDPVKMHDGYIPAAIKPDDNIGLKISKRAVDGTYILVKMVADYVRANMPLGDSIGLRSGS